MRSFLYLHKETYQRKCSLSFVRVSEEYPVLFKIPGRCETGEAYTPSKDAETVGSLGHCMASHSSRTIPIIFAGKYSAGNN